MPNSIHTTFELLAQTRNPAAVDVLVSALDVADEGVQTLAVGALLKRRPTLGIVEVIRRVPELCGPARELIEDNGPDLGSGLRDCLLSDDPVLWANALELVRRLEGYAEVPTLIGRLQAPHASERGAIEDVIVELVNRLYERLKLAKEADESDSHLREDERIRQHMLATLESAAYRYAAHRCRALVEGLLVLGDPENLHLKKFLRDADDEVRGVAADLMCSSRHPGVMRLVVDSMSQNYPFPAAYTAFERRTDPEFICHLLRRWPKKPTAFEQKNFREIKAVAWLEPERLHLDGIPAALHRTLISFIMATGLTQVQKLAALEWMVRFGSPEGRLAATDVLVELEDDKVQEVVLESLESEEPEVQAWATSQLRAWAIPKAMELLVERLDSKMPEVREAARGELAGFNVHRAIELFDHLDSRMQVAVGKLVRKIDPETIQKLKDEMQNAIRRRRIRAARAALAMKLHLEVVDALLAMARDSDNLVRRTAAEILGKVPTREAADMLRLLKQDASPRVREAAAAALHELHEQQDDIPIPTASRPHANLSPETLL